MKENPFLREIEMKNKKMMRGTLPPLFDRIVDDKNDVGFRHQLLNTKDLQSSIIQELSIILNTRCTVRKVIYDDHIDTIPFFGLPDFFGLGDFSYFDGTNTQHWPQIARFIETAIQAAEPRLQDIYVQVERFDSLNQSLIVAVSAMMKEGTLVKEMHFPLNLRYWGNSSQQNAA